MGLPADPAPAAFSRNGRAIKLIGAAQNETCEGLPADTKVSVRKARASKMRGYLSVLRSRDRMDDDALRREAIRLYRRYQTEIVEALKLCPWAERARLDGRVREEVVLTAELDPEPALAAIDALSRDGSVQIGLLLFPRLRAGLEAFERFVSELVTRDAERRELGTAPFALAAFHPDARADLSDPERAIPFLRRTPDPTIQLVRYEALESVREGFNEGTQFIDVKVLMTLDWTRDDTLPLRERIARANLRTVTKVGVESIEERYADIFRDRDATYR